MRRGDLVVVAVNGDYGKPRPAVVVQSDVFPDTHASVIICPTTSELTDAPDFRITIEPADTNGLRETSQIMVDKPVSIKRERIGQIIGRLTTDEILKLDTVLAFVMGLAD
ncbi:type II toxin-antitoxin system PemK/MazF family toxin [Telmatospirillum siberiense]|uniref:Type II toxin-antitoxin system PemK/MazF family toxin n=1 Tax=Telmatospirillum siberiense TaxID=382514 RepID=A0A2N3PM26_9PROT|nr:type II toxin-antitoxin system PemK/MazF family toxin [Telmatospirillum siberiense]PKU21451.1 type II toxin-antitoxin system PemK/MazF family toxin [Telmatospirillum siberiense]